MYTAGRFDAGPGQRLSAIGSNAFQLTALTSFTVPANVTMLGNDVVSGCPLSSMTFLSAEAPHLNFYHSKPIYLYQKLDSNENVLGPDPDFRVVLAGDAAGHEDGLSVRLAGCHVPL